MDKRKVLVPGEEYGRHIDLTCENHPNLRWTTKNIYPLGSRSVFFKGDVEVLQKLEDDPAIGNIKRLLLAKEYSKECDCSFDDLHVVDLHKVN